jgi:non-lysosomal glucosylceramidase
MDQSKCDRRDFLKWGSAASLFVATSNYRAFGSETLRPEQLYAQYVPGDKGLDPEWVSSLQKRGHSLDEAIAYDMKKEVDPEVIGMTVGGVGCGTVYLSGDGQLWIWDIFNQHHEGVVANPRNELPDGMSAHKQKFRERDGTNYIFPPRVSDHRNGVDAQFSILLSGKEIPLNASGWEDVSFTGRWPVGMVAYHSSAIPLQVQLEAYSPFLPLNLKDSSLPVTVLDYTFKNTGKQAVEFQFRGSLNNALGQFSKNESHRTTGPVSGEGWKGLQHGLGEEEAVKSALDYGSMSLACFGEEKAQVGKDDAITLALILKPGEEKVVTLAVAWHLPNLNLKHGCGERRRHYVNDFEDASEVVGYFARHRKRLSAETRNWVATWNDSTLPQWLLDRTMLPANTLQTQCCLIFDDGRFWAWEGIGCCPGTCGHVWQYAQGHARLFPEIERNLRELTDYGPALQEDGRVFFRGVNNRQAAIDAQCAYILRTLRDHQLSDDPAYLKRVWPATKKALNYLINFDKADPRGGLDGLLDGKQHNTLDAEWYGKVHVLCTMYLAALRAGEELAGAMNDDAYAKEVRAIFEKGRKNIEVLYNGEFYEQIEDPAHLDKIGVGKGCYIDQVMGQYWANQVGLGAHFQCRPPEVGPARPLEIQLRSRLWALPEGVYPGPTVWCSGDSGLLMCTWPKGGLRSDFKKHWQYMYFNEFMTGFEYEVAAHMVAERDPDLVEKGLAITRAIHDRYSAKRGRNPYNEIECSDHYSRAGSAYAVFLAICGFEFDQAKGRIAFHPVFQKDHFKAPFTTSEAWGSYEQKDGGASIKITHGKLTLNQVELGIFKGATPKATLNGKAVKIDQLALKKGDVLQLSLS